MSQVFSRETPFQTVFFRLENLMSRDARVIENVLEGSLPTAGRTQGSPLQKSSRRGELHVRPRPEPISRTPSQTRFFGLEKYASQTVFSTATHTNLERWPR